jgi:hypothetical protein
MNERLICIFLGSQEFSAIAIHEQLVTVLDLNAIACSIVINHLKEMKWAAGTKESIEAEVLTSLIK